MGFGWVGISVFRIFADLHFQLHTFVIWGMPALAKAFARLSSQSAMSSGIGSISLAQALIKNTSHSKAAAKFS